MLRRGVRSLALGCSRVMCERRGVRRAAQTLCQCEACILRVRSRVSDARTTLHRVEQQRMQRTRFRPVASVADAV